MANEELTHTIDFLLGGAQYDLNSTEQQLRQQAESIIRRMERLIGDLDAGRTVNNLGEMQGSGSRLDQLCAERYVQQKRVQDLQRVQQAFEAAEAE